MKSKMFQANYQETCQYTGTNCDHAQGILAQDSTKILICDGQYWKVRLI